MYEKLIEKAKNQVIDPNVYYERHHIIPKYLGGSNKEENLVLLTYRQHILAHLLLWRRYGNYEDLCAYKLMKNLSSSRKSEIGKLIGERHKRSGHIYNLGQKNKETNWINEIKTPESLSRGGKRAGAIAKETGQIQSIQTKESCSSGGKIGGKIAKETGQIQSIAKYKGTYILIMPDKKEFLHCFQAAEYMGVTSSKISNYCKNNRQGYSRRKKLPEELGMKGKIITGSN